MGTDGAAPAPPGRPRRRTSAVVTAVLHLLALWLYWLSVLVAPTWGWIALLALWAVFALAAVLVHRRWGGLSAVVPLVAVLTWFAVVTLGDRFLGWTA